MTTPSPALLGQFPITAPDIRVSVSPGGVAVDSDALMTETTSEIENLLQRLTCALIEEPGSNPDFPSTQRRGIGIQGYLGSTTDRLPGLSASIDREFELDPAVLKSTTTLGTDADGNPTVNTEVETVIGVWGFAWAWSPKGLVPAPPTAIPA